LCVEEVCESKAAVVDLDRQKAYWSAKVSLDGAASNAGHC